MKQYDGRLRIYNSQMVRIADENENSVYRDNRNDTIQTSLYEFRIPTNVKYWYFQCTREERDESRFSQDSSRFSRDESREKRDASRETVVTYSTAQK